MIQVEKKAARRAERKWTSGGQGRVESGDSGDDLVVLPRTKTSVTPASRGPPLFQTEAWPLCGSLCMRVHVHIYILRAAWVRTCKTSVPFVCVHAREYPV